MSFLVVFEDGSSKIFAHEENVPDSESVTLVLPLNDHECCMAKLVNDDGREQVVRGLGTTLVKAFNRGFSRGRQKGREQADENEVIAALKRIADVPEPDLISEIQSLTRKVRDMNYDECRAAGDFLMAVGAHKLPAGQAMIRSLTVQLQYINLKQKLDRLITD